MNFFWRDERLSFMDFSHIHEKSLALAVITKDEDGKENLEVFSGKTTWDGIDVLFHPSTDDPPFLLPPEYLAKIEKVKGEFRDILKGSEYVITLRMDMMQNENFVIPPDSENQ